MKRGARHKEIRDGSGYWSIACDQTTWTLIASILGRMSTNSTRDWRGVTCGNCLRTKKATARVLSAKR